MCVCFYVLVSSAGKVMDKSQEEIEKERKEETFLKKATILVD